MVWIYDQRTTDMGYSYKVQREASSLDLALASQLHYLLLFYQDL